MSQFEITRDFSMSKYYGQCNRIIGEWVFTLTTFRFVNVNSGDNQKIVEC